MGNFFSSCMSGDGEEYREPSPQHSGHVIHAPSSSAKDKMQGTISKEMIVHATPSGPISPDGGYSLVEDGMHGDISTEIVDHATPSGPISPDGSPSSAEDGMQDNSNEMVVLSKQSGHVNVACPPEAGTQDPMSNQMEVLPSPSGHVSPLTPSSDDNTGSPPHVAYSPLHYMLGEGSFGRVFQATHCSSQQNVAITSVLKMNGTCNSLDIELDEPGTVQEDEGGSSSHKLFPENAYVKALKHQDSIFLEGAPVTACISQTQRYASRSQALTSTMYDVQQACQLSFITDLGPTGPEGFILKRSGGHRIQGLYWAGRQRFCYHWSKRWLVVKDSFLLFLRPDSGEISYVQLFDPEFQAQVGKRHTDTKDSIRVQNYTRSLILKCNSNRQAHWWGQKINQFAEDHGEEFLRIHRFGAHSSAREGTQVQWFNGGATYFSALADALMQAQEEIFITDWWLSPEVHLKRPALDDKWRLDVLLKRKAEAGVRVFVLLYKEIELALGINSAYSKRALMRLHPNIKVMRFPDHISSMVFLWAHHEKMVAIDQSIVFLGGLDLAYGRWDDHEYRLTDMGSSRMEQQNGPVAVDTSPEEAKVVPQYWLGKDYSNLILKDQEELDKPFEDIMDRLKSPRMPWRDIGVVVLGKAARDASRHFIQRWNLAKSSKLKYKGQVYPYLLPKSLSTVERHAYSVPGCHSATVQVLRSVDGWSAGCNECSILNAYLHCISNAEHYIYIENQFFISSTGGSTIHNTIAQAIVNRISRAHKENTTFRVFIVLPLLPGFVGNIDLGGGNSMQAIMHYTYSTLCRGENSIISQLKEEMGSFWQRYLSVCGLRKHGDMPDGSLVTELVYIHSKMLIVDDRMAIIASANINDRSMLGKRDSELAVYVEDKEFVNSTMNGNAYQAGKFALSLRMDCFNTILGALKSPCADVSDPISNQFFHDVWTDTALSNTALYEQVFRCLPTNAVPSHRVRHAYTAVPKLAKTDPKLSRKVLQRVKGILVEFPLDFLSEENLLPPITSIEGIISHDVWT